MGLINTGNRSYEEYRAWLQSPEGQQAAQAERARGQSRAAAGGTPYGMISSDGMVQPPPGWSSGASPSSPRPMQGQNNMGGRRQPSGSPGPPMTPPSTSPRPQPQSMPPRPGQSQRGPVQTGQAPRQRLPADSPWRNAPSHGPEADAAVRAQFPGLYGQAPSPGQAQPQQTQPQGTPYNPQQGGNFSAYSPQQPATQRGDPSIQPASPGLTMAPGMEAAVFGGERGGRPQQPQGGNYSAFDPNMANNAQAPRPPAFQASYGQLGGGFSDQPGTQQRDAFISQINNQLGQMQSQSRQQPMGAPQFDFARMFNQADNMVQQGYQNPFSRMR